MAHTLQLILFAFVSMCSVLLGGCRSTPIPTGDRLVSISWVNQGPGTLQQIETRLCGSPTGVRLDILPGYSEKWIPLDQPLYKSCKITVKIQTGSGAASIPHLWLESPRRKSPEREYNLRIQFIPGLPLEAALEPANLMRTRLQVP